MPGYVEEELRGYLECGMLCFRFGRALCTGCGQGFVIAFARKVKRRLPFAQRQAHNPDRPPRRSRHPAGVRAGEGDLRAQAIAEISSLTALPPSPPSRESSSLRSTDCSPLPQA